MEHTESKHNSAACFASSSTKFLGLSPPRLLHTSAAAPRPRHEASGLQLRQGPLHLCQEALIPDSTMATSFRVSPRHLCHGGWGLRVPCTSLVGTTGAHRNFLPGCEQPEWGHRTWPLGHKGPGLSPSLPGRRAEPQPCTAALRAHPVSGQPTRLPCVRTSSEPRAGLCLPLLSSWFSLRIASASCPAVEGTELF